MRIRGLPLLLLGALACDEPGLGPAQASLGFDRAALDVGRVPEGTTAAVTVLVRNTGRAVGQGALVAEGPFTVAPVRVEVPGGVTRPVVVTFAPPAVGVFEGVLRLGDASMALRGEARAVLPCPAPEPCRTFVFDFASETCLARAEPDGRSCDSPCLASATCRSGTCVGVPRVCDDENVCTTDACNPATGCVHAPGARTCAEPEESCRAASCDPEEGCVTGPAPDGTPCGPFSCEEAHLCFGGSCHTFEPPDGIPCAGESPCRDAGVCVNRVCVQPEARVLEPEWVYWPEPDRYVDFPGLVDADGNLYWLEQEQSRTTMPDLVSADTAGRIRFRVLLDGDRANSPLVAAWGGLALADNLLISSLGSNLVEAISTADGSPVWRLDAAHTVSGGAFDSTTAPPSMTTGGLLLGAGNVVYALVTDTDIRLSRRPGVARAWILRLDVGTGRVEWMWSTTRFIMSLMLDRDGNLIVTDLDDGVSSVASLSAEGAERWRRTTIMGFSFATASDRVLYRSSHLSAELFATDDGHSVAMVPFSFSGWPLQTSPVMLDGRGYVLHAPPDIYPPAVPDPPALSLSAFDLSSGGSLWTLPLEPDWPVAVSQPLATSRGSILVAVGKGNYEDYSFETRLTDVRVDGRVRFSCRLPPDGAYRHPLALSRGRLVTTVGPDHDLGRPIRAFRLPGYAEAPSGWTTLSGNQQRTGAPRP